jgi:hypothetical protein
MDKDFSCGFFRWQLVNQRVWIARDPVDPDRRWIIRPSMGFNPLFRFELISICNGTTSKRENHNNPVCLAFKAVTIRLQDIVDNIYKHGDLFEDNVAERHRMFLMSMLNFGEENNAKTPSVEKAYEGEGTVVGEEPVLFI